MSRMRMALSALGDLQAPAGQWERVEERLDAVGPALSAVASASPAPGRRAPLVPGMALFTRWPLQAAAVFALFAGGLLVGRTVGFGGADSRADGPVLTEVTGTPSTGTDLDFGVGPEADYLRTAVDLSGLRDRALGGGASPTDPRVMTERITQLDVLAELTRRALEEAPADPVLNNFLFEVMDERESLAGGLAKMLRTTAVEYR